MVLSQTKKNLYIDLIIAFLAIFLVVFLLLDVSSKFYVDWFNHVWTIGYNSLYIKSNFYPPFTINVFQNIFSPWQIFYGFLFYPVTGLVGTIFGPNLALRLIVIFLFSFQYFFVYKLIYLISNNRVFANLISILITWSIYPLTNLYNRSAITEFTATILAQIALCIFLILIFDNTNIPILKYCFYFFLAISLCIGSHPITAFYFFLFLVFVVIIFLPFLIKFLKNKKNVLILLVFICLIILTFLPWLYANYFAGKDLAVKLYSINKGSEFFPDSIDHPLRRYWLVLLGDSRIKYSNLNNISTPFLDTQINIVLLLLILFFITFKCFRKESKFNNKSSKYFRFNSFLFCSVSLFSTTLLSSSGKIFKILPKIFSIIQFNYRMVTYQNFAIFIILVVLFFYYKINFDEKIFSKILITALVVISFSNVLIKIDHAILIKNLINLNTTISNENISNFNKVAYYPYSKNDFGSFPSTFYYTSAYSNIIEIPPIEGNIDGNLYFTLKKQPFGEIESEKHINITKTGWYLTNISRFKWNKIIVDNKILDTKFISGNEGNLVIYLQKGVHHVSANFNPPKVFKILWYISIFLIYLSIIILILLIIINLGKKILHSYILKTQKNKY